MPSLRHYNIGDKLGGDTLEWKNDDESIQIWSNSQRNRFIVKDADDGVSIKYLHSLGAAIEEAKKSVSKDSNVVIEKTPSGKVKFIDTVTGFVSRPFGKGTQ